MSAGDGEWHYHAVALFHVCYSRAGFFNDAHKFMTQHFVVELWYKSIINMQVGAAYGSRGYLQYNIIRHFDFRIFYIVNADVADLMKYCCFHVFCLG